MATYTEAQLALLTAIKNVGSIVTITPEDLAYLTEALLQIGGGAQVAPSQPVMEAQAALLERIKIKAEVENNSENVAYLSTALQTMASTNALDEVQQYVLTAKGQITTLSQETIAAIIAIRDQQVNYFDTIKGYYDGTVAIRDGLQQRFTQVDGYVTTINGQYNTIVQIKQAVDGAEARVLSITNRLDAAVADASTSAQTATTKRQDIENYEVRVRDLRDDFLTRYLGAYDNDPTDAAGKPLTIGMLYWSKTSNVMKAYGTGGWDVAYAPAGSYLNKSGGVMTGPIVFSGDQTFPALNDYALKTHVHTMQDISDLSAAARDVLAKTTLATMRTALGLGNVNNTLDADKPISNATKAALDLKATIAALNLKADNSALSAKADVSAVDLKAPKASPIFTGDAEFQGTAVVPTLARTDTSRKIANAAFVQDLIAASISGGTVKSVNGKAGTDIVLYKADIDLGNVENLSPAKMPVSEAQAIEIAKRATLASPSFTGKPLAPTPSTTVSDDQIATTSFVQALINAFKGSAPAGLDTIAEIATALNNDPSFYNSIVNQLANKASTSHTHSVSQISGALSINDFQGNRGGYYGWVRLPNGIILQGASTVTYLSGGTPGTGYISYNTSYPSAVITALITNGEPSSPSFSGQAGVSVDGAPGNSGFSVRYAHAGGQSMAGNARINWFSMGY